MLKKCKSQAKLDNNANAREACTDICTRGEQGKPCNHYVKMHSCQGSSTQEEDQGVTRKTLKSRNVELEGNVLIQKACQALEMEATVTHLLGDKQADTR